MNRRTFVKLSGGAVLFTSANPLSCFSNVPAKDVMDRIGMSTVTFRERFHQTSEEDSPSNPLTILETPEYFADRFGVNNVEFWSLHFESTTPAYLKEVRKKVEDAKATLINIQCDEEYQISSTNKKERKESMELVLQWVEVCAAIGSKAIRVNPGEGDIDLAIEGFKVINQACKKHGLILMIENHFGLATQPADHIRLIQETDPSNVFALPDFGNYPEELDRYAALKQVLPYAYQISAKVTDFNADGEHIGFDYDRCVQIAEDAGFTGIYSVEQWSGEPNDMPADKMVDWLIEHTKKNIDS